MLVHYFPERNIPGWSGDESEQVKTYPAGTLYTVLSDKYPAAAHLVGYVVPGETEIPRLNVGSLKYFKKQPFENQPRMVLAVVDVDNPDHAPHTDPKAALQAVLAQVQGTPLQGQVYMTPHGYRIVYVLSTPIHVLSYEVWATAFLAYLASFGIEADPTCVEWNRMYALPHITKARGEKTLDLPVHFDDTTTPLSWWPNPEGVPCDAPPFPLTEHDVDPALWNKLAQDLPSGMAATLRRGLVLAPKGRRDTALVQTIGMVLATTRGDGYLAWQVLARSVHADQTDGAPTLTKLWDRIQHFAPAAQPPSVQQPDDSQRMKMTGPSPTTLMGIGEVAPLLYGTGDGYRVWDEKHLKYSEPYKAAAMYAAITQLSPTANVQLRTPKGKHRPVSEILEAYGSPVEHISCEYGQVNNQKAERYDKSTRTLWRSTATPTALTPQYNEQCQAWLDTLVKGVQQRALLDWIATAHMTDRPTCALYLQAGPGVGKGLFVGALAMLWGQTPVPYVDATGDFNARLAECPIVHIDESLQVRKGDTNWSAAFRSLVSESAHRLRQLYVPSASLIGCPRLVITANNGDALKLRERLEAEDIQAIQERILHLRCNNEARDYLLELGGREGTKDWVRDSNNNPGVLVRHLAYIQATRVVASEGRYLVQGQPSEWHEELGLSDPRTLAPLTLMTLILANGSLPPSSRIVKDEVGTTLWINSKKLLDLWRKYLNEEPPTVTHLSLTLKRLSAGPRKQQVLGKERVRLWPIDTRTLLKVADMQGIVNPDAVQSTLDNAVSYTYADVELANEQEYT